MKFKLQLAMLAIKDTGKQVKETKQCQPSQKEPCDVLCCDDIVVNLKLASCLIISKELSRMQRASTVDSIR